MTSPPIGRPPTWTEQAECLTHPPQLWDADAPPTDQAMAVLICTTCPVQQECLTEYGRDDYAGIVAGLTPEQRGHLYGITAHDIRPPHGTRSRFIGSSRWPGCRCDPCHRAHADYERAMRAKRRAAKAAGKTGELSAQPRTINE